VQIDWFTLAAQVVNFLILLLLLRRFLFRPVMGIMEKREKNIADRMADVEQKKQDVEREASKYRKKRDALSEEREQEIDATKKEAEKIKKDAEREAKDEAETLRRRWQESLQHDKENLLNRVRREIGEQVCATGRAVLSDLADESLEKRIVEMFSRRLSEMNRDELRKIAADSREADGKATLVSAFEIEDQLRQRLKNEIKDALENSVDVRFKTDRGIICGIEMQTSGHTLRWSIDSYLDELERRFAERIATSAVESKDTDDSNADKASGEKSDG
jgi:F-type H+-transporting ATPase subunit b